jgi:transcriptional regulator with XRE-family HTH domain
MTREQVLMHPAYWFEHEQNELYRQVTDYMEKEKITRTELARRLKVHKSYVSQILNGNFNYTLKKWIELCLAIGIVPGEYRKIEDVIQADIEFAKAKNASSLEKKTRIEDDKTINMVPLHPTKLRIVAGSKMFEQFTESQRQLA